MQRNGSIAMPLRITYLLLVLLACECGANRSVPVMLQLQFYQIQICISNRLDAVGLSAYQHHELWVGCLDQWRRQIVCWPQESSFNARTVLQENRRYVITLSLRRQSSTHTQYLNITNTISCHFTESFVFSCECFFFHNISTECL